MRVAFSGWICSDCLIWIANGDLSGIESEEDVARIRDADGESATGYWVPGGDCEEHDDGAECCPYGGCETLEFSWSSCDRCGSDLGGSRHAASILETETEE